MPIRNPKGPKPLRPIREGDTRTVNIHFESHEPTNFYWSKKTPSGKTKVKSGPSKGIKTHIFEPVGKRFTPMQTKADIETFLDNLQKYAGHKKNSNYVRSTRRYFNEALKKGVALRQGESAKTQEEREAHQKVFDTFVNALNKRKNNPTFDNYVETRKALGELGKFREELVVKRILEVLEQGNVEARYGAGHYGLSRKLQQKGITSNRSFDNPIFEWNMIVLNKISHEKPVTTLDYKRAYISQKLSRFFNQSQYSSALDQVCIGKLTETQLDSFIKKLDSRKMKLESIFTEVLQANGAKLASLKNKNDFEEMAYKLIQPTFIGSRLKPPIRKK